MCRFAHGVEAGPEVLYSVLNILLVLLAIRWESLHALLLYTCDASLLGNRAHNDVPYFTNCLDCRSKGGGMIVISATQEPHAQARRGHILLLLC
jgi:hypothetical protein